MVTWESRVTSRPAVLAVSAVVEDTCTVTVRSGEVEPVWKVPVGTNAAV